MLSESNSPIVARLLRSQNSLRVWSLIITFFGDSIVPRGGEVWLGTLSQVMRGFGIDEQAVRAAVSRLAKDGWLARARLGRNSYYRLLENGNREFLVATDRIYGPGAPSFDGRVTVITGRRLDREPPKANDFLVKHGWGRMAPNVHCAFGKRTDGGALPEGFIRIAGDISVADAKDLIGTAWDLATIDQAYRDFLQAFEILGSAGELAADPFDALLLRTLLVHAFRRVVLRDPMLPVDLMAANWPGVSARARAAALYRALSPAAELWLDDNAVDRNGGVPASVTAMPGRFAGQV